MQPLGQLNVLIVEDRPEDLDFTRECLSALNVGEPTHVASMDNMKVQLENHRFDVVLLDLCLPETQGLDTVRLARSLVGNSNAPDTPIIVLTGIDDFAISKEALKCGAKDYLVKGEFGPHELHRALTFATFGHCNPKRGKSSIINRLWGC